MDDYLSIEDKAALIFHTFGPELLPDKETKPDHEEEKGECDECCSFSFLLVALGLNLPNSL